MPRAMARGAAELLHVGAGLGGDVAAIAAAPPGLLPGRPAIRGGG